MVVGLLTDFGEQDPYVSSMKAVIHGINPSVKVVDVTHEVPSFSVEEAAFKLFIARRVFPRGSAFVVVVDPGVGGARRPVLIVTHRYYYIGPDNGVLYEPAKDDGILGVYELDNEAFHMKPTSRTFHGRDIFAPAAAWLSLGTPPELLGTRLPPESLVKLDIMEHEVSESYVRCRVASVDKFGNLILNVPASKIPWASYGVKVVARFKDASAEMTLVPTFSSVKPGSLALIVDSFGMLEIVANMDSAARITKLSVGDYVVLERRG